MPTGIEVKMSSSYSGESGRRADPERIVDYIHNDLEDVGVHLDGGSPPKQLNWNDPDDRERIRRKFRENDDRTVKKQEAILPGFGEEGTGENAREDCGENHPFLCDSCASRVDFGRTCAQSVCARCGVSWARDLAIKKSAKVRRVRKEKNYHTPDNEHQLIHHQIVSPSAGWYYALARAGLPMEEAQELTREVVKFILDEMRAQGVLVRHSFRGAREDGSVKEESDDRGLWKERLNSGRDWYGDVRDQLAWMPHYHCVVVGDFLKGDEFTDRIEELTGWVIHRIADEESGVSVPNDGAMARLTTYTLSHADIMVREDSHNRSAVWEVGSFQGDPIKSSARFSAPPADLEWADRVVRRAAAKVLGLKSGTTDCGAELPAVDDPDQLAKNILEELYPDDPEGRADVDPDAVLHHVAEGNIDVEVSTLRGGGGTVSIGSGHAGQLPNSPAGLAGDAGDLPWSATGVATAVASDGGAEPIVDDQEDSDDGCGCGHDHDDDGGHDDDGAAEECDGTLIPLGEARQRGLLDDDDWLSAAPFSEEALEADREHPDDLVPWRTSSPGKAVGG